MGSQIVSSWFAELSDNRMITDIGPGCPQCGTHNGSGMWVYLMPTDADWERGGRRTVAAQCAGCHRVEHFDVSEAQCDTVQRVRASHSTARHLCCDGTFRHWREMGAVYNVIPGGK